MLKLSKTEMESHRCLQLFVVIISSKAKSEKSHNFSFLSTTLHGSNWVCILYSLTDLEIQGTTVS